MRVWNDVTRVQIYYSDLGDTKRRCEDICSKWRGITPADPGAAKAAPPPVRDAVDDLADQVQAFIDAHEKLPSKNKISQAVLGKPFAGSYAHRINAALRRLAEREPSSTTTTPINVNDEALPERNRALDTVVVEQPVEQPMEVWM